MKEDEVYRLPNAFEVVGSPCDTVIAILTEALAEARAGRIQMLGLATVGHDGKSAHGIACGAGTDKIQLLGAIERMKHHLNCKVREEDTR